MRAVWGCYKYTKWSCMHVEAMCPSLPGLRRIYRHGLEAAVDMLPRRVRHQAEIAGQILQTSVVKVAGMLTYGGV